MKFILLIQTLLLWTGLALAQELVEPVKPPALAKEGNIQIGMVKIWAETDKCMPGNGSNEKEKSIHKYCRDLREYKLQVAARDAERCKSFSTYTMREKCEKTKKVNEQKRKDKIVENKEPPVFSIDIEKDLLAKATEACEQMSGEKKVKKCLEQNESEAKILAYQKSCYKCMEGEHLKECLNLEKYGHDRKLKRELQVAAMMDTCFAYTEEKAKFNGCNFYKATMLQLESQADNCKSFRSPSMQTECEKVKKDPNYAFDGERSVGEFTKENKKQTVDYLQHEVNAGQQ